MRNRVTGRFFTTVLLLGFAFILCGCGGIEISDDYRQGAKNDCATQASPGDYQACLDAVDRSYEDYQNAKSN